MEEQVNEQTLQPPTRWEADLEFVQSLANPMYVHFLAQNKYLESREFLNYLEYLEFWRDPPYLRFIVYPNCLYMLTLLQQPSFREEIGKFEVAQALMDSFWKKWAGIDDNAPQDTTHVQPPENNEASAAAINENVA